MTRLRYNGLAYAAAPLTLGGSLTSSGTTITFTSALKYNGGTAVPTITGSDYIPFTILDANGLISEVIYLTAYTAGATSGTITRGQEGTTGVSHASGDKLRHAATVADFNGDDSWTTPTYANGWSGYSSDTSWHPGAYRKDGAGFVHLRGLIIGGTIPATAFTLPAGYRPGRGVIFAVASNSAFGRVDIGANGTVQIGQGNNAYVSLDGITFYAEG